jgi:ArsR family transcriptional regulator
MRAQKNLHRNSFGKINPDIILDIMSNETRRKILSILSEEPMYFNQLARKVHVGQQAILRHMDVLENSGIIESYEEKSTLGAPNRKYYKVRTTFSLNVSLSNDSFSMVNREITETRLKPTLKLYKYLDSFPRNRGTKQLSYLKDSLLDIESQIDALEDRINDLRALKQNLLTYLHLVCFDAKFDPLESDLIYKIIKRSPQTMHDLSEMVDATDEELSLAISTLYDKLDNSSAKRFLTKYRRITKISDH